MSEDGLYLNGRWVALVDSSLTLQANDIRKPDTIQASRTNAFTLPDTLAIRELLAGAEQVDAAGSAPYATIPAQLVADGEVVFAGSARLLSFAGGWKCVLRGGLKALMETLSALRLRDLDLGRYDHPWTDSSMSLLAGREAGITYPAVDYGNYESGVFGGDSLFPAIYVHTLVAELLAPTGYRPTGEWTQDPLYRRLALPFTGDAPTAKDADFVTDRTARVTIATAFPEQDRTDTVIPFSVANQPRNGFTDGAAGNFKPALNAYVCDAVMRLRVQASQTIKVKVDFGSMEAALIVEKNGVNAGQAYFTAGGPYNISGTRLDTLELDTLVDCRPGDVLRIRLRAARRSTVAQWHFFASVDPGTTTASFTPDTAVRPGDTWPVARNLPDLTGGDLLRALALMMSGTFLVDDDLRTLRLVTLDAVRAGEPQDLSASVEESVEPELTVGLEPYGRLNRLRWKELEGVTPYGDGLIEAPRLESPPETDLFELPFAAVTDSPRQLPGYGSPLLIQTRTYSGTGSSRSLGISPTAPRLILIEPGRTVTAQLFYTTAEGARRQGSVTLSGCWWGTRPPALKSGPVALSLSFTRLGPAHGEQTLQERYFSALTALLERPRSLAVSLILRPDELAALDLARPISLQGVRAGSIYLSTNRYYLNTLSNYRYGPPATALLIPFD